MSITRLIPVALVCLMVTAAVRADLDSGPDVGGTVPALPVVSIADDGTTAEADAAAERKERPTVYVFIQAEHWDRPTARFVRGLDEAVARVGKESRIVAVWLSDDTDRAAEYLPVARRSLQLQATDLVYHDGQAGPADWNIDIDASLTAVVVHAGKVEFRRGYRSINETVVPVVERALNKALEEP